jgi:anti-sigma-K factor RskA
MDTRELAAAFLLGELDEREAAEFDRRVERDPALQAEVEAMRPLLDELAQLPGAGWPPASPPAPAAAPAAAVTPPRRNSRRRLWSLRPAFAVAALAAALLVGGGAGALLAGGDDEASRPAAALTLGPLAPASQASGEVAMPKPDEMVLTVHDLPPSRRGQYYELWLLDGAAQTVPVASFRVGPSGSASLRVPLPANPARYRYFDVSRQRASQGTEHSADSVLRGPTARS